MTVSPALFYALVWAFLLSACLAWFWFSKLSDRVNEVNKLRRVVASNERYYDETITMVYQDICDREHLRVRELPTLNVNLANTVRDTYNHPELTSYAIPFDFKFSKDDVQIFFWKRDHTELDACELARLWLAGVQWISK